MPDGENHRKFIFFGPSASGLKVTVSGGDVVVVSPGLPLGTALTKREIGDEVTLTVDK